MGGGSYNLQSRSIRASTLGYHTKSREEIFSKKLSEEMDPRNFKVREARDNPDHPASLPIILGLDFTGSMGNIPHELIKDGLPTLMGTVIEKGAKDATICFVAIGDYKCDKVPIQMGQFEASDEKLDYWLEQATFEGVAGGGNGGEGYSLAWYLAAHRTSIDSMLKRGIKGLLITIGDENNHGTLPASAVRGFTGDNVEKDYTSAELLKEAQKSWEVYHLELAGGSIRSGWKETLGKNCIAVDNYQDVSNVVAQIILDYAKPKDRIPVDDEHIHTDDAGDQEIIL